MKNTENQMDKSVDTLPVSELLIKSAQKGLPEGWTRATFILQTKHLEKIKALAYWKRKKIKNVLDEIFDSYFQGKRIRPIPKEVEVTLKKLKNQQ